MSTRQRGTRGGPAGRWSRRGTAPTADQPTPGTGADDSPEADPESAARGIVLSRLTASPRTRAELEDTLAGRGVSDEVADRVLDRFSEVGLVDDAAFAETWVRSRHAARGLSRRALGAELRRKGVDDEVAQEALGQIDVEDERAAAEALVVKRLRSTRRQPYEARVRRLAGMLARKGYPGGLALSVVRQALAEERAGPSSDA